MVEGKIINFPVKPTQKDIMRPERAELIHMLTMLSEEALAYVQRPIAYAHYWTDAHNPDLLTDEDMDRLQLYCVVSNESPAFVRELDRWLDHVRRMERAGILPERATP